MARPALVTLTDAAAERVKALEQAGAQFIQIDEPAVSTRVEEVDLAVEAMKAGDRLLLDDGKIRMRVIEATGGFIAAEVVNGYDASDRVVQQRFKTGQYAVEYAANGSETTVTDRAGRPSRCAVDCWMSAE